MELSMDNMDIVAGGILAIMLALFMLTVIVTSYNKCIASRNDGYALILSIDL